MKRPDDNLLKWLDEVFLGQYLPILGINYGAINGSGEGGCGRSSRPSDNGGPSFKKFFFGPSGLILV